MAEHPFWRYFAVAEPESLILPAQDRLIAFILMSIAILILTIQTIYYISKLRDESGQAGSNVSFHYIVMFLGIYLAAFNSAVIRISIYFTNGQYTILSQQKAVLFFLGVLVFVHGITNVSISIIDFKKRTKRMIKFVYWTFLIITTVVILFQILFIGGMDQLEPIIFVLLRLTPIIALGMNITFIISLILEARSSPSKIEQLRLLLLSLSVFLFALTLVTTGGTGVFKDPSDPTIFIILTTYIVPLTYLIVTPLMNIILFWSLLTPNWLLVKSGVIQPSFKAFLEKRKNK